MSLNDLEIQESQRFDSYVTLIGFKNMKTPPPTIFLPIHSRSNGGGLFVYFICRHHPRFVGAKDLMIPITLKCTNILTTTEPLIISEAGSNRNTRPLARRIITMKCNSKRNDLDTHFRCPLTLWRADFGGVTQISERTQLVPRDESLMLNSRWR